MRAKVTKVRDLKAVLKDLEHHVKAPDFLRKGREFRNFALRPREVLANVLICAAGNFDDPENRLTVCTDPFGADGLVLNERHGGYMTTEHVFVPSKAGDAETVESRILSAIEHKRKKGVTYAKGKDLVIFSEAKGTWMPNEVATKIAGRHDFETVWVVHLEHGAENGCSYCVSWLDASKGNAPCWRVSINADFTDWQTELAPTCGIEQASVEAIRKTLQPFVSPPTRESGTCERVRHIPKSVEIHEALDITRKSTPTRGHSE